MTTKLLQLIDAAIELPNALHACVEMAHELSEIRSESELANSASAMEEHAKLNEMIRDQREANEQLTSKLVHEIERSRKETEMRHDLVARLTDAESKNADLKSELLQAKELAAKLMVDLMERGERLANVELRASIDSDALNEFLEWASPLAQSISGTVAGQLTSDIVREHVEDLTRKLAESERKLAEAESELFVWRSKS